MSSVFTPLTPELPAVIVDRVHLKVTTLGDADLLAFFADAAGTAGGNIRMLQRPDPKYEAGDPLPGLVFWCLSNPSGFEIGGGRFRIGVGWRMVYPEADRFRASGAADAASLVWKLVRVLWANDRLTDASGMDPKADKIERFAAQIFQGLGYPNSVCVDLIEGEVVYESMIDKGDI